MEITGPLGKQIESRIKFKKDTENQQKLSKSIDETKSKRRLSLFSKFKTTLKEQI